MIIIPNYSGTSPNQSLFFADGGLTELMAYLQDTPKLHAGTTAGGPSDFDCDDFNGYTSWGDVVRMAADGWSEGAERLHGNMFKPVFAHESKRPHWDVDVAGDSPDIGRFLAGDPRHMRRRKTVKGHKPVVTLYIGMGVRGTVTTKQFTNFGTAVCQMIDTLEHSGTRVELNQLTRAFMSGNSFSHAVTGWRVKDADQHIDMAALAFTYMHPAAHRRLQFQMRARMGSGTGGSTDVNFKDFPDAPENAIIFAGISEYGNQCNTTHDARRFLRNRINIAAGEELITEDMITEFQD